VSSPARRRGVATSSAVHVATVPEGHDDDDEAVILDRVNHAVIPDSDSPRGAAREWPGGRRSWVVGEQSDRALDPTGSRRVEFAKLPSGSGA
jgi:hypothetical protein